jgi:hypothetical protein
LQVGRRYAASMRPVHSGSFPLIVKGSACG